MLSLVKIPVKSARWAQMGGSYIYKVLICRVILLDEKVMVAPSGDYLAPPLIDVFLARNKKRDKNPYTSFRNPIPTLKFLRPG